MLVTEYDLFIDLDFERLKYEGRVLIKLKTEENPVLNSVGLDIKLVSAAGRTTPFAQKGEDLVVEAGAFDGTLQVDFAGAVPDSLAGIYRAQYDHTHIVTTHFEAAQARRMFPCVDRPDVKAEFKLAIRIDNGLEGISNMPVDSVKPDGEKKVVTFQKSPKMSTYLLYLGVGKFESHSAKFGRTEIILATTPGKVALGKFSEEEAQKALRYLEPYFGIPFALPKVHLVAVPEFAMGAMENWGAITFRETRLLIDDSTSTRIKMQVCLAMTHELAHQWFGDLVTMHWWDDIWLNESFATFLTYKAVDTFHPDWKVWNNFVNGDPRVETLAGALSRDSLKNTHPIEVPVKSPDEIEQIFDAISYGKGGHVLQMIEAYVGAQAFRDGVRRYLKEHAYSNASGNDLWAALEKVSGKPVTKIMSRWIKQPGFPVVTASLHDGKLNLRQERFLLSGEVEGSTWPIPIILEVNGERRSILMEDAEQTVDAHGLESLKINPDRTGFYSVRYENLDEHVWRSKLSPYDKWGLVFDALLFLQSGRMTFAEYLSVLNRFKKENETLPAQEVSDHLALLCVLVPSKIEAIAKEFNHSLLDALQGRVDENSSMLRGRLASRLALIDDAYASKLAAEFKNYRKVPPDMKQAVAIGYARSTNDYDGLVRAHRGSTSDEDKDRFLTALPALKDMSLVRRALDFSISGEVKRQDAIYVLASAVDRPQAKDLAWDWLQTNLPKLQAMYQSTGILSGALQMMIPILGIGRAQEMHSFFQTHKMPDAEMGIKAGLEKLEIYDRLVRNIMHAST